MSQEFPVGETACGGTLHIDARILGTGGLGRFTGRARDGSSVHISYVCASRHDATTLRKRLDYQVDGAAKFVDVGALDSPEATGSIVLAEALPSGAPLVELSFDERRRSAFTIARALARTIQHASRASIALVGIAPDCVFLDSTTGLINLAPRAPVLMASLPSRIIREPWAQPSFSVKHGLFADPACLNPWAATPASDVYCLGLVLSWMLEGKHPFAEVATSNDDWITPMTMGSRDVYTGPGEVEALLQRALNPDPEERISIDDFAGQLDRHQ